MVQRGRGDRYHYGCFENDIVNMILSLLKITHASVDTLKSLNEIMTWGENAFPKSHSLSITYYNVFSKRHNKPLLQSLAGEVQRLSKQYIRSFAIVFG